MNKYIYICIGIVTLLFSSCTEDFESNFDKSATERYLEKKGEFSKRLQDAEYGWVLQHFPAKERTRGGVNYYFNFEDDTHVVVSGEAYDVNSEKDRTGYALKGSAGVFLSLNTYNVIGHDLSTPSAEKYRAFGGEFEFNLLDTSTSKDTIEVIGRVTRNAMRLIKLKESWGDYDKKVKAIESLMSGARFYGAINGAKEIEASKGAGRRLTFVYGEGADAKEVEEAYIITDKGLYFYEPITIEGKEYREFIVDLKTSKVVSLDGVIVFDIYKTPLDFNVLWGINVGDETNASEKVRKAYAHITDVNDKRYGQRYGISLLQVFFLGNSNGDKGVHFIAQRTNKTLYTPSYGFDFIPVKGKKDEVGFVSLGEVGEWWGSFTHLSPMVDFLIANSSYKIQKISETEVKLTSASDPEVWFVMKQLKLN